MMMDMIMKIKETPLPQDSRISMRQGGKKDFLQIFNANLKANEGINSSNATNSTSESKFNTNTYQSTQRKSKEVKEDTLVEEGSYEKLDEEGIVGVEVLLHQVQIVLNQLDQESITVGDALVEIQNLLGEIHPDLVEQLAPDLKDLLLKLKNGINQMKIEAPPEELLLKVEELKGKLSGDLKDGLVDNKETIIPEQTGISDQTIKLEAEQQLQTSPTKIAVEMPQEKLVEDTMEPGQNIQVETKGVNNVKNSELQEDLPLEETIEVNFQRGEIPFEGTKHFKDINIQGDQELKVDPKQFIQEVINKVQIMVRDGKSEMKIQLMPENLGSIFINISLDKGTMTAKLYAENNQIKELIDSNLTQLKVALDDKGINISKLEVSVGHNQQDFNGQKFQFQQRNKFKLKAVNSINLANGLNPMIYADEVSQVNPYGYNSKFDGLA